MPIGPFNHITATYTAAHARFYEKLVAPSVLRSHRTIDELFLNQLPANARVLDVGAGGGLITQHLADQRPDLTIIGVDLSEPQVQNAKSRLSKYQDRVTFQKGDATSLDFPDRSFDGVMSYGSVKHWTSREAGMNECVRVLKPGGPLLVTDADRSATFDDTRNFVMHCRTPRFLHGAVLAFFRTWIAGRSIDLDDGRALAAGADLTNVHVSRIPNFPLLIISGHRATT